MGQTQIRIGGFGGQGVILSGIMIGRAAALHAERYATLVQSYGPEARGSHSSAEVIIADKPIACPYVREADILIALSQDAYARFVPRLKSHGTLITEADLVRLEPEPATAARFSVPATRLAEALGRRVVLNVIVVGFFAALSHVLPPDALERAVLESVPAESRDMNLSAFRRGLEAGREAIAARPESTAP